MVRRQRVHSCIFVLVYLVIVVGIVSLSSTSSWHRQVAGAMGGRLIPTITHSLSSSTAARRFHVLAATAIRGGRDHSSAATATTTTTRGRVNRLAFLPPTPTCSLFFHSTARSSSSSQAKDSTNRQLKQPQKQNKPPSPLWAKSKKKGAKNKNELFRADRVLAQRTEMSRSECFELLQKKRIWQKGVGASSEANENEDEDWIAVPGPSSKLLMHTPLWIDKTHQVPLPPPLMMAYHKPKWVLSVTKDPVLERPCLDESIIPQGMHPVGRLDYDSSGLLLFSSVGALTQRLLHPKHEIPKVYEVVVTDRVDKGKLKEQLTTGVTTGEGVHTADLLSVEFFPDEAVAPYLKQVQSGIPPHYNQTDLEQRGYLDIFNATALSTVTLRVREGKYRMVRRIMANCGHPVVTLVRRQFGEVGLQDLPEGSLRALTLEEENWVRSIVSVKK